MMIFFFDKGPCSDEDPAGQGYSLSLGGNFVIARVASNSVKIE
jgi:hypothetical protein